MITITNPIPLRLRTLMGLSDVLKTITPANGYIDDLSDTLDDEGNAVSHVCRGRAVYGDSDPETMISILENPHSEPALHETGGRGSTVTIGPWDLLIQGWTKDDKVNPSDPAHVFMAEVKLALAMENANRQGDPGYSLFGVGRSVSDMVIGSGVVRPADEVSVKAYFWLTLTLTMAEDIQNPFA